MNHCDQPMTTIQYYYTEPESYDGVSEYRCEKCGVRIGRWTGKELKEGEVEARYGIKKR